MAKFQLDNVEIDTFQLINSENKSVNIEPITAEFVITENLNLMGTVIDIILTDSLDLRTTFPIVGDELIDVVFKTNQSEYDFKKIHYLFKIVSMTRYDRDIRNQTYVLRGVTFEVINNLQKSVNQSYTKLTIDKIIKGIFESYIKVPPVINGFAATKYPNKEIVTLEKTLEEKSYVFPGMDPFKVVRFLCNEAQIHPSKDSSLGNNFLFYLDRKGWHFTTKDLLMKKEPVFKFGFADKTLELGNDGPKELKFDPYETILEINSTKTFDDITGIESGLFNYLIETIDPITKQFSEDFFVYRDQKKNFTHSELEGSPPYPVNKKFGLITDGSDYSKVYDSGRSTYTISNIGDNYTNKEYIKNAKGGDNQIDNPRTIHKDLKYKQAMKNSFMIEYQLKIPGNTLLNVGDNIELYLPSIGEAKLNEVDKLTGKKFLITEVKHTVSKNKESASPFFTAITIERNTYGNYKNYLKSEG